MKMEINLRPRLEQRLVLAPQIIQSIEILQLPLLALRERIEQEQLENPLLEIVDDERLDSGHERLEQARAEHEVKSPDPEDFAKLDNITEDYHEYFTTGAPRADRDEEGEDKMEALQNAPSPPGKLQDFLLEQLHLLEHPPRLREVAENIIHNLDRDGRLPYTLEEVAASVEPPATPEEAEAALRIVQSLDPKGVGARNLQECLLLQLGPRDPDYALQKQLIEHHLHDIECNRLAKIQKETGADLDALRRAIAYICSLNPAPGRMYDNEVVPYVTPEVIVNLVDGAYVVTLDESNIPRLRISQVYRDMLNEAGNDSQAREFLRKKLESARWLIESIEQRRNTLLKVARAIVQAQRAFFDEGISALRPLRMQDIADATGVHVATVSRAVRHKYMQTPRGIFPMKFFFTGGTNADSSIPTWDAVKQRIKEIIDSEDKTKPLSDDEIAARLKEEGHLQIARRTVTKYRKELGIPSSRQRRRH